MKISIFTWTSELSGLLSQTAKDSGIEVVSVDLRDRSASLEGLLDKVTTDILMIESSVDQQRQDIQTLAKFTSLHLMVEVVLLTSQRDEALMVAAMQAGIREVLLTPALPQDLTDVFSRLTHRQKSLPTKDKKKAKTIAFMSCKGGSGATFLSTNFAYIVAKKLAYNTLFLDLDLQSGDAVYYVSPGPNKFNITDITRQIERLDAKLLASSVLHVAPHFDLLSAPEESESSHDISPLHLERLLEVASVNYDTVVLDLDRVITPLTAKAIELSDVIYVVMENLLPFLRDAKRLIAKCRSMGYEDDKIKLIVNRYEKSDIIDVAQIEKVVGIKVSHAIVSSFQDVAQAINTGTPLMQINPDNPIVETLSSMASTLESRESHQRGSWIHRLMGT